MSDDDQDRMDRLEALAGQQELVTLAINAYLAEYPDPVATTAANNATHAAVGLRRAITVIEQRLRREEERATRKADWAAKPKREKLIEELAQINDRTYEEQEAIVLEARRRYRASGPMKPLSEQLAVAPKLGVVPRASDG
jgi:hypothetical protein